MSFFFETQLSCCGCRRQISVPCSSRVFQPWQQARTQLAADPPWCRWKTVFESSAVWSCHRQSLLHIIFFNLCQVAGQHRHYYPGMLRSRDHIFGLGLIVVGLGLMGAGLEVSYRGGWLFRLFSQNVWQFTWGTGFLEVQWLLNVECWHTYIRTASTSQSQCCVCRLDSSHYIEHFACVDFTEFLFLPYSFNRTGLSLGLIVFGLGLTRHVWSRSRSRSRSHSLWSWSQSRSHCVVVSLTSLVITCSKENNFFKKSIVCFVWQLLKMSPECATHLIDRKLCSKIVPTAT